MGKTTRNTGGSHAPLGGPTNPTEPAPFLQGKRIRIDDGGIQFSDDGGIPDYVIGVRADNKLGLAGPVAFSDAVDVLGTLTAYGYFGAGGNFGIGSGVSQGSFFGATAVSKPTVTGARNSDEGALKSLLTALASLGLITDSTTAS